MDELKIMENVGFPFTQDRLDFMQRALRLAIIMLGKAINPGAQNNSYIVAGAAFSIDGGTYSVTEGIIILNGEPCYVPAHTGDTNTYYDWYIDEENAGTAQTFGDASSQYPNHTRYAKVMAFATDGPEGGIGIADVPNSLPAWTDITPYLKNGWTILAGHTAELQINYLGAKVTVELRGWLDASDASNDEALDISDLTGEQPDQASAHAIAVAASDDSTVPSAVEWLLAGSSGVVSMDYDTSKTNKSLSGVKFYLS